MYLLGAMVQSLDVSPDYIEKIARTASHLYKRYSVPKKRGGKRTIHHPSRELKALQRWLLQNVITRLPKHKAVSAYEPGCNIASHAKKHLKGKYLLRLDLEDFFPSLTSADIAQHLLLHRGLLPERWDNEDTHLFIQLVCLNQRLTIGSVTSPSLSNSLCYGMDCRISEYSKTKRILYTRYADDLYFSTSEPNVLMEVESAIAEILADIDYPNRLRLNYAKTMHGSPKGRKAVTGVILTTQGRLSVGRDRKRTVRALVHRFERLSDRERLSLAGMISHIESIEPGFTKRLQRKYGDEAIEDVRAVHTTERSVRIEKNGVEDVA